MNGMSTHRLPLHRSIPVIVALAVVLTGCSMGVSSDPTEATGANAPAVENTQGDTGSNLPEETTSEETGREPDPVEASTEEPAPEAPTDPAEEATELTREELLKDVSKQLRCPDGTLTIDGVSPRVEIIDDCDEVIVTADISTVVAKKVGHLHLQSVGSDIVIASADKITVDENADINEVVWEEGNPDIEDSSVGSTLLPAGFAQ